MGIFYDIVIIAKKLYIMSVSINIMFHIYIYIIQSKVKHSSDQFESTQFDNFHIATVIYMPIKFEELLRKFVF